MVVRMLLNALPVGENMKVFLGVAAICGGSSLFMLSSARFARCLLTARVASSCAHAAAPCTEKSKAYDSMADKIADQKARAEEQEKQQEQAQLNR